MKNRTHPRSSRRRRYLWLGGGGVLVIMVLVIASVALWTWSRWRSVPDYWDENRRFLQSSPPDRLQHYARSAEQKVLGGVSDGPAPADTRTVAVSFEEINAWFALRLRDWLAHQEIALPGEVKEVMVTGDGDRLVVAFQYDGPQLRQVISMVFQLSVESDGQLLARLVGMRAGDLPADPRTVAERFLGGRNDRAVREFLGLIDGKRLDAVLPHPADSRRELRVTDLRVQPQGLLLHVKSQRLQP